MTFIEIVAGQRQRWGLVSKLGEGDAGEVYQVESLLERKPAILKRPHRSAFSNDILRQSAQIKNEGSILAALAGLLSSTRFPSVTVPTLLDQSSGGAETGERAFIVIEKAAGIDLASLARWSRFSPDPAELEAIPGAAGRLARHIVHAGTLPEPFLLMVLANLVDLFSIIHSPQTTSNPQIAGIIWNDIKTQHLYWDPSKSCLTVIDWGNSQFLEEDGSSKDRRFSVADDQRQFLDEIGHFLVEYQPDLAEKLEWPAEITPVERPSEHYLPLRNRLHALQAASVTSLRELQRRESDSLAVTTPDQANITELIQLHERILDFGVAPAEHGMDALYARLAMRLATQEKLDEFRAAVRQASSTATGQTEPWLLLDRIASIPDAEHASHLKPVCKALSLALAGDWPSALWELAIAGQEGISPDWWEAISRQIRSHHLGLSADAITPHVAATRAYYTLEACVIQASSIKISDNSAPLQELLQVYSEEVIKKWRQVEPAPPYSGIDYAEITSLLDEMDELVPGSHKTLENNLVQARAQVEITLNAWRDKDFETAKRGLRQIFIWDPDRFRLFQADRAIQLTPRWQLRLRQGPVSGEPFPDFVTAVELQGREIRNQVGAAPWLDLILQTLKQLRNGGKPADLLLMHPELLTDIPWLSEYRSRETISLPHQTPFSFDRRPLAHSGSDFRGVDEGRLGQNMDLQLTTPLDTWLPEARGSSARVFSGILNNIPGEMAVKVMRPERAEYALPLFREEVQILSILHDVPGITPLAEMGFIQLSPGMNLPVEDRSISAAGLRGELQRFGSEQVQNFLTILEPRASQGWIPYIILEKRNHQDNLIMYCDAGHTRGWFLPLRESLFLVLQICDILQIAHDRNIVYRDHKILHYYWDPGSAGVIMIDWNIARRHPQGLTSSERQFDIVQFGARALHHILTGRPAPGALPLGPNRPEDIEQSAHQYAVQWTYDDERLPQQVKEIVAEVLRAGYANIKDLRNDLYSVYTQTRDTPAEPGG